MADTLTITLAQLNQSVGNLAGNAAAMLAALVLDISSTPYSAMPTPPHRHFPNKNSLLRREKTDSLRRFLSIHYQMEEPCWWPQTSRGPGPVNGDS